MKKSTKRYLFIQDVKDFLASAVLVVIIVVILGVVVYGIRHKDDILHYASSNVVISEDEDEIYFVEEHTVADFSDAIVAESVKDSELIVTTVDVKIPVDIKKTGAFDLSIFEKNQRILYKGVGRFVLDLSQFTEKNVTLDNDEMTITIEIPHPQMMHVEIKPNEFEFEDTKKGLLAFGELKFTPSEYNEILTTCKTKMEQQVDTKANRLAADESAIENMMKIYEPLVKAVDDEYDLKVQFIEKSNPKE